jgi:hypothetical protein
MIALLENHYDSSTNTVKIPEALRPYAPLLVSEDGLRIPSSRLTKNDELILK